MQIKAYTCTYMHIYLHYLEYVCMCMYMLVYACMEIVFICIDMYMLV